MRAARIRNAGRILQYAKHDAAVFFARHCRDDGDDRRRGCKLDWTAKQRDSRLCLVYARMSTAWTLHT